MTIVDIINTKRILNLPHPTTDKMIINAEKALGLNFTKEYKDYVKHFGTIVYYGHELTGLNTVKYKNVVYLTLKEKNNFDIIADDWYVIEQLHIDGIVIWQSSTGEIYQTAPGSKPEKICNTLAEYIQLD